MKDLRDKTRVSPPLDLSDDFLPSLLQIDGISASLPPDLSDDFGTSMPQIDGISASPVPDLSGYFCTSPLQIDGVWASPSLTNQTNLMEDLFDEIWKPVPPIDQTNPIQEFSREQEKTDLGPLQDRNSQQETAGLSPLHVATNHGHQLNQVAETSAKPSGKGGKRKRSDIQKEEHKIRCRNYRQKQKSMGEELKNEVQRLANEEQSQKKEIEAQKKQIQRLEKQMKKQRSQNDELQGQNNNVNEMIVECLALIEASNANVPAAAADFFRKLEEDEERNVDSKDFAGLDENQECREVGKYQIPLSLVPTADRITKFHGDVCATSTISRIHTGKIYILFCATIKEMSELRLQEVTEKTMLKWRDAIKDALSVKFKVEFAMEHLKKTVAPRYFGMKLEAEEIDVIPKVEAYLNGLKECKKLRDIAKEFDDKPFSEGLWG